MSEPTMEQMLEDFGRAYARYEPDKARAKVLARFAELERERDCYRAVLGGMEFPNLDMLVVKGEAFCAALGQTAKSRIEELSTFGFISAAIAQRGGKNDA